MSEAVAAAAGPILPTLRELALLRSAGQDDDDFVLRGLWNVNYRFRPNAYERDLAYSLMMAQTLWQGCAYCFWGTTTIDDTLLGQDARQLQPADPGTAIAVLDAVYGSFERHPTGLAIYDGNAHEKTVYRANIITSEVIRVLSTSRRKRLLNIGVMGNFVPLLREAGVELVGSDFDDLLVASGINGAAVHHGSRTLELIADADCVLATGMTLTTGTLDAIVARCRELGTPLIVYAATGGHFCEEYCRTFGVDVAIAELQPQYMFQGPSRIEIFRRNAVGGQVRQTSKGVRPYGYEPPA